MEKQRIVDLAIQTEIYRPQASREQHLSFWKESIEQQFPKINTETMDMGEIAQLSPEIISKIINQAHNGEQKIMNTFLWDSSTATREEIIQDVSKTLQEDTIMFAEPEMAKSLGIRAISGHAQEGHSIFTNKKQNTSTKNVLDAIGKRKYFQTKSQEGIDNIIYCMEDWMGNIEKKINNINPKSNIIYLKNRNGKPLNGFSFFDEKMPIDILEYMGGFLFSSLMDNFPNIRKNIFQKYGKQMGGGESYLTNMEKLKEYGIDITHLSGINYQGIFKILNYTDPENRIKILNNLNIIKSEKLDLEKIADGTQTWDEIKSNSSVTNLLKDSKLWGQYIRNTQGMGVGDDIAIFLSAFLPQTYTNQGHRESHLAYQSRMMGALSADQIDTFEKDSSLFIPGGQDEIAGHYINGRFRRLCQSKKFREAFNIRERRDGEYNLISKSVIRDFTAASANTQEEHVHSSQRWFYKETEGTCAISEYTKHLYQSAKSRGKKIERKDIDNLCIDLYNRSSNACLTFRQIPIGLIKKILDNRLELIIEPREREKNLSSFYSNK
jgi:hypothetical protein